MAWIKLQIHPEHDKVLALADLTGASPERVFAAAVRWFLWVDAHAENDSITISRRAFRDVTRWKGDGLAEAMLNDRVDWLAETGHGLTPTRWETHMSQGAKVRALTAKRAAKVRTERYESNADSVTKVTQTALRKAHLDQTRPDKKREELVRPDQDPMSAAADSVGRSVGPDAELGKMIRALGLNRATEKRLESLPDLTGAEINDVYASVKATPGIRSIAATVAAELLKRRGVELRRRGPMSTSVASIADAALSRIEEIRRNRGARA